MNAALNLRVPYAMELVSYSSNNHTRIILACKQVSSWLSMNSTLYINTDLILSAFMTEVLLHHTKLNIYFISLISTGFLCFDGDSFILRMQNPPADSPDKVVYHN